MQPYPIEHHDTLAPCRCGRAGVDVVGLDWTVDMADARARLGDDVSLQGNVDPVVLFAEQEAIEAAVRLGLCFVCVCVRGEGGAVSVIL